jgi:hypothetical protein
MDRTVSEDTPITIAIVLALWAAAVLGGWAGGIFAKLDDEELVTLSVFAVLFALGTWSLDPAVRAFALRHVAIGPVALGLDAIVMIDAFLLASGEGFARLASMPNVAVLLFVLPLATAATAAAISRLGGARRIRSARGKSPGATPAAT